MCDPIKGFLSRKSLLVTSKRLKGRCNQHKTRSIKWTFYIATIFIPLSPDTGFFLPLDGGPLPEPLPPACSPRSPWFGKKNLSFYLVTNSCTPMTGIVKSWVHCSAFILRVSLQHLRVAIKTNMAVLFLRWRAYIRIIGYWASAVEKRIGYQH